MKNLVVTGLLALVLTACGGSGGGVVHVVDRPVNYTPELRSFDLLDSYDVDTRYDDHTPLALNPYAYEGLFDIFWRANSLEDFHLQLLVNDEPYPDNALLIYSERCGAGRQCDQGGSLICEYTPHFTMGCGLGPDVDISLLVRQVPQEVYLLLQVCDIDSTYCEFSHFPVWME
jgi:hypothetical protein